MFETIFKTPVMVTRYQLAPFAEERARFLHSLSESGYKPHSIYLACRHLLTVATALQRQHRGLLCMTTDEVDQALWAGRHSSSPKETGARRALAHRWLRFLGCLRESPFPFQELMAEYCRWIHEEPGLCDEKIAVARVLNDADLLPRWKRSTVSSGEYNFRPNGPNQQWHTDVMYVWDAARFYFLVSFVDAYSRYIEEITHP